jgi:hypothetical protein
MSDENTPVEEVKETVEEVAEPPVVEPPTKDDRPEWVDEILESIKAINVPAEEVQEVIETPVESVEEADEPPRGVPWTHRGFRRNGEH